MNGLRAEKQEKNQKKVKEENTTTTTTRARARLYGIDVDVARRLLANTNLLIMDVFAASMRIKGMTTDEVKAWIGYMDEVGYRFATGQQVNRRNFRRSLRMWHKKNEETALRRGEALMVRMRHRANRFGGLGQNAEEMERIKAKIAADKHARAMAADDAWILCEERCAEFNADGCSQCRHCSVPPQLRERPIPPEECIHFKRKFC